MKYQVKMVAIVWLELEAQTADEAMREAETLTQSDVEDLAREQAQDWQWIPAEIGLER